MTTCRPVKGFEGLYEIDSTGTVRSAKTGKVRKTTVWDRYPRVTLTKKGVQTTVSVHRLVWECFVGPIPEGLQINHKNGVKDDNRLENLEVCTPSENVAHGFRVLGRTPPNNPNHGSKNGSARLMESDIPIIRELAHSGVLTHIIAKRFGVHNTTIRRVVRGDRWKGA